MDGHEIVHRLVGCLLGRLDPLQHPHQGCNGIADLNVHELNLLIDCLLELCIDETKLLLKVLHAGSVLVLGADGISQRDDPGLCAGEEDRIEVGTTHADIGSGETQRGNQLFGTQAFGSNLSVVCIKKFVCLTIQAPDSSCDRVIEVRGHELIAGILSIEEVTGCLEQRQHLHNRVVLGVPAMYCRYLLICDLDQAVAGGNTHAVVENLGKYAFRDFIEGMARDAGALQNCLEGTGSDRIVLTIHLQQEAGILHRILQDICSTVVVIDLHIQIPERGSPFHRLKSEFLRRGGHPLAAGFPIAEELEKVPRLAEATTEIVREYFAFHHLLVPPFE